jgi:site-specific DNA recombinase
MRTAAYARYSSDAQREASLEDQLRNCRGYCSRQGWPDPVVFQDAALSGARADRPGYQALLAAAHEFDVILVDDLSRLSRDSIESAKAVKRLTFAGVRLISVSDGIDTARKDAKVGAGLRGLMSELYLDDLAEKTHRGLTGRALAGASAGGLPYGYRVAGVGQRAIDEAQAAVVRRIYAEYLDGRSARDIAATLNVEGVPSTRGGTWSASVIFGDVRRGIGILANPIYKGEQVWNRSRWVKHPETGRRVRQERPRADWIVTQHAELAIVSAETWDAVQRRIGGVSRDTRGGLAHGARGRPPRHLLSGMLRCGECDGPMVIVDRYCYGCSTAKERGTCSGSLRVPRRVAESALLASIREDLLSDEAFALVQRRVTAELRRRGPNLDSLKRRLESAERERENILAAIRAGIFTTSTKAELERVERDVASATADLDAAKRAKPSEIVPRLRDRWRRVLAALADVGRNVGAARDALQQLLGDRITVRRNENGDLVAEVAASSSLMDLVAGAGCGLYLSTTTCIALAAADYTPTVVQSQRESVPSVGKASRAPRRKTRR